MQFDAPLTDGAGAGFSVEYHTTPRNARLRKYRMQGEPCYVRFDHDHWTDIEAWLECLSAEDQLLKLRWTNRAWEILGKGMGTQVDDESAEPGATVDPGRTGGLE